MKTIDNIIIFIIATTSVIYDFICYLLQKPRPIETPWPRLIICRWRGHKDGVIWYNMSGHEPDMHCRHCGDDLS